MILLVVNGIIPSTSATGNQNSEANTLILLIGLVITILSACIIMGNYKFYLKMTNENDCKLGYLFDGFKLFNKSILLKILTSIYVFLWSLLLVIPGIIAGFAYALTPYIILEDSSISVSQAI